MNMTKSRVFPLDLKIDRTLLDNPGKKNIDDPLFTYLVIVLSWVKELNTRCIQ